jgi:LysR family transcriptional regulator for bpeEF and oprC
MSADLFHAISVFVRVAEARSFTAAARRLGITASAASKALARLEEQLDVRLVNRTTRSVSLTTDGDAFFDRCKQILVELEDAQAAVQHRRTKLQGRIRVQMPVAFGRKIVIPLIARFLEKHPALTVDVCLTDRVSDVPEEGIDVVVHIGEVRSASVVARKLCDLRYVAVASPGYLARFGAPARPDDLERHRCLAYYVPQTNRYRDWSFLDDGRRLSKSIAGMLNVNSAEGLLDAAIAGAGIATVSTFIAADAVRAGQLKILLRPFVCEGPRVSVVYHQRLWLSARVRTFIDYLVAEVPPSPPWDSILD